MKLDKINVWDRSSLESTEILELSKRLLNQYLISKVDKQICVSKIVETEAYKAPEDKASHAAGNKKTKRTEIMFGQAGMGYVYLCYGIHNMMNVITGPLGCAHAILIRAIEPILGHEYMSIRRNTTSYNLTNGPGKLCKALGITRQHNGIDLCSKESVVWLGINTSLQEDQLITGPRVGIGYAQECAHWPWRFRIKANLWTSPPNKVEY